MNDRLKVFGIIAILGFVAGIIAEVTAVNIIPWISANIPSLNGVLPYLTAGIAGAIITVLLVAIWAMLTGRKNQ
jgi:hypothetical protein